MSRKKGFALLAVAATGVLLALLLVPPGALSSGAGWHGVAEAVSGISADDANTSRDTSASAAAGSSAADGDDDIPPEMRNQFADIARDYAEDARYPDYAKPLTEKDWHLLHPRAFVPRKVPLLNAPGVTATLVLAQSIVDRGVALPVRVLIAAEHGTEAIAGDMAVRVMLQRKGQRSAMVTLASASEAAAEAGVARAFTGELSAEVLRSVPEGEAAVIAELVFESGEYANATAPVTLYEAAARLLRVGDARVEGADLVIPAYFDVQKPGQYRVAGNLFRADGGQPVSHLNAQFALSAQNSAGLLKVHAVTLRATAAEGPYVLRDIDITRMPDKPGDLTAYGSTTGETFAVRGFPLDAYSHEPFEDPAAKQRLEFLQKMAGAQ
jgi:hypothetical protein